jgi:proton glutamate symport protein
VILSGTLLYFGLPLEAVAIILGVDELMDMGRTTVNVIGNCLAAVIMGRWEGEFSPSFVSGAGSWEPQPASLESRVGNPDLSTRTNPGS